MFVFLSPAAIRSQWVFFEAGYAYSRGIRVVPVGILGFDLTQLAPPITLLQGFNLRSFDGLNNIVTLLNSQFELTLAENFASQEYAQIFGAAAVDRVSALGRYSRYVYEVSVYLSCDAPLAIDTAKRLIHEKGLQSAESEASVTAAGAAFFCKGDRVVGADLDPALLDITLPLIDEWLAVIGNSPECHVELTIQLNKSIRNVFMPHRLTARIFGTPIELTLDGRLQFADAYLTISRGSAGSYVELKFAQRSVASLRLGELLDILFDREVLYRIDVAVAP